MSEPPQSARTRTIRRFGWSALLLWALLGFALEAAHGLKLGLYLDDELTRLLLRLAHAHGVGLALVVLAFGEAGVPLFEDARDRGASVALRVAALAMPLGFLASAPMHPEGDPNLLILLVPLGGCALLYALAATAYASWRR